jgi:hypothetical protein
MDELLGAAEFMGRKLGAPHGDLYARWLKGVFEAVVPSNPKMVRAVRAIHAAKVPICTLNYDLLLENVLGRESGEAGLLAFGKRPACLAATAVQSD